MYSVYIIICDKAFFYVGITIDLSKRIKEHQSGYSNHTGRYQNIELVYHEKYLSRTKAKKREEQIKGWSREKKKALIDRNLERLKKLSKSKS